MPLIVREGDELSTGHICASTTTLDTPTQSQVYVHGKLVARITDKTVSHPFPPLPPCAPHVAQINEGSPNVFVHGLNVADIGDSADSGNMTDAKNNINVYANGN